LQSLLALSRVIDAFNARLGQWLSWLVVVAVLVSSGNAIIRKVFDSSSNAFLELQWVLFGIVFLLCSPWTLLSNEHIRIDIVNHGLPIKVRGWIDMIGHVLFLVPFLVILLVTSVPFFITSYKQNEQSFSAGGLPQWPAKSLIMIACVLLLARTDPRFQRDGRERA
jgi:TRAP-type mannitol/chloroaromatic compound transport system permease small subunit